MEHRCTRALLPCDWKFWGGVFLIMRCSLKQLISFVWATLHFWIFCPLSTWYGLIWTPWSSPHVSCRSYYDNSCPNVFLFVVSCSGIHCSPMSLPYRNCNAHTCSRTRLVGRSGQSRALLVVMVIHRKHMSGPCFTFHDLWHRPSHGPLCIIQPQQESHW